MLRQFHKMHGLGNDFVILDAREEPLAMDRELARRLADRKRGIGCDQLILLEPSEFADLRMRIFNEDGSEVQSCGNATRCVVQLTGAGTIDTAGGLLRGEQAGGQVEVALVEPRFAWDAIPLADPLPTDPLPLAWGRLERPHAVNVGNPHLVFFVEELDSTDFGATPAEIEADPLFPGRINVNLAEVTETGLRLRTFERGVGYTLACGTGACASAVVAIRTGRLRSPVEVEMPGGTLTVSWSPGEPVRMRGDATYVFEGMIDIP
jgi:diaminopimelate epimerase